MVRRAKRPRPVERPAARQLAEQAADLRHLERLVQLERRQDAGQAAREHRLAGARRAAQEEVMAAGRGDLEGAPRLLLAVDLGEVVLDGSAPAASSGGRASDGGNRLDPEQVTA